MHTFGTPCAIAEIRTICSRSKIKLVEDAAQALGSSSGNKMCGTFGDAGVLSFNGNKILTTGGGGAILTSSSSLYDTARHLATTAKISHPYEYIHDKVGYNYRMPNLNAALGFSQLKKLNRFVYEKKKLRQFYQELIEICIYAYSIDPPSGSGAFTPCRILHSMAGGVPCLTKVLEERFREIWLFSWWKVCPAGLGPWA